jgi:4-hydroxybenzoyl-CoA reductase subunit alpha
MREFSVVGRRFPRRDADQKATGEAQYTADLQLPRMLVGKILRSPYPHAKILNIDTRKAERLPGVKAVVTSDDTPKTRFGWTIMDEPVFALDDALYFGEPVAAVAAIDEDTTQEALDSFRWTAGNCQRWPTLWRR